MNENQARQLAHAYELMGYDTAIENTGGNVYLVHVKGSNAAPVTVFGIDTVTRYGNDEALVTGEPTSITYLD